MIVIRYTRTNCIDSNTNTMSILCVTCVQIGGSFYDIFIDQFKNNVFEYDYDFTSCTCSSYFLYLNFLISPLIKTLFAEDV